jgi:propanol-preferring alcohol dehydrogenase
MSRKHGVCVLVRIPPGEFQLSIFDRMTKCVTVRGSFVGARQDSGFFKTSLTWK